eukprot:TRINITY_DN9517_c0_g1_i1.p2 TRINITY_DN9517_c0_g1~~TRINITY_DN9517_c0_g1_i1.p2  ORF type:complete len:181 (+),score=14.60 TRINITY_DN9517_c0_g1_i1:139-681(+)
MDVRLVIRLDIPSDDFRPLEVEREVWVPLDMNLHKFCDMVAIPVMGWCRGYHSYAVIEQEDGFGATWGPPKTCTVDTSHAPARCFYAMGDASKVTLLQALLPFVTPDEVTTKYQLCASLLRTHRGIRFLYDWGDGFCHQISPVQLRESTRSASDSGLADLNQIPAMCIPPSHTQGHTLSL